MEQSNHQEKRLYAIAKLTSRLKKNWKIRAVAEIETDEEVKKNYRNIQWEGRKFVVTLKDNSGEIEAVAFKFAAKFESQIQNNKEYYVSGARIEKANKGFQEKHKYHLILDENALFQACSSGAASVGSTSTAMSTPQKVQFQPRTVNEAQTIGTSEHFDILGIVKKLYAAEPKHNKKSGARFYSKQVCVADKTGEVIISFSGEKAKHLDPLKKMKNQIIGVVGCHWATEKKDLLYASSNDVYEGRNMPAHVISKVRELRQWWEASGKPRPSAAKGKSDASPEKRGTKRTHEEQEHGSDSLNGCSGPSDLKMKKMNFKKFESLTKIGRDAFQFYFDTKFPPQDFSKFLMDNKDTMQYGRGGSKFTDEQMDVLFPGKKSTATSSKLDVTIMYKLLRNYGIDIPSPTKDWGKKPDIGQKLIGDDLERIRSYRNKVNHATEETNVMDDDNSFMWWNDLKQAIVRLSGGRLKKEIEDLETSTF